MPSPLREQIARAIWEGVWQSFSDDDPVGSWASSRNEGGAWAYRVADAVLPLVEAERVAERAAERLRLHTQLRDQITALPTAGTRFMFGVQETGPISSREFKRTVLALLGVAATPQPAPPDSCGQCGTPIGGAHSPMCRAQHRATTPQPEEHDA